MRRKPTPLDPVTALEMASQALLELVNEGWSYGSQRRAMAIRDAVEETLRVIQRNRQHPNRPWQLVKPIGVNAIAGPQTATPRGVR